MRIGGLTIERTKTLDLRIKALTAAALSSVPGSRGWWPLVRELSTGAWQRNEDVQIDTVLSNPTLYACVTLIQNDIGKLRPRIVEIDEAGIKTEIQSPAFSPVLRRPNHFQDRIDHYKWWLNSKLVHGNTFAIKARDARGVVVAQYILDPTRVQTLVAPDSSVFYALHQDELCKVRDAIVVPAREMFHDKCPPLFHPLVGVSPIYAAGWPAMQGLNIRRMSDTFFSAGGKPGGILQAVGDISPEEAARLKTYWDTNFSGDNTGKVAVLAGGLSYTPLSFITAEQSQLVEQLKITDEDICRAFHMPRHKVQVGNDPTYDNIEALNQQYYSDCLQEHIESAELKLKEGYDLPPNYGVDFDLSDLFRMDSGSRMEFATTGVKGGIIAINEGRRMFDMKPVTGGELPMQQQQMFPLAALADRDDAGVPRSAAPPSGPTVADEGDGELSAASLIVAKAEFYKALTA